MTMASSNTPINVDDRFNEYESVSKHQKFTTSKVWDEMTKLECENKNELKAQHNHFSCQKNHFRENQALLYDGVFFQVRCCTHILNLIVQVGLELADDVVDPRYKLNYVQYYFTTIYSDHASNFVQTILSNLKLLFKEYVKNSKSMSSSFAGSSNVSNNDHVDSSLHELNVNRVDLGEDYVESDDYRRYLNESSTKSERSHLDIYLEELELELNYQIEVLDY
ncbi:hypothetical protein PVK06_002542 [Gossypium arboreum]|uniref:hAT-like transposase RNase-H fold domain-containing protein n=1 Tax=Gossypium arboreum TaxID=29729 RepID=A0ABR0R531_GOSAR|nr:hypothetical protein PVK06_002542 [Gossypium arboreum]